MSQGLRAGQQRPEQLVIPGRRDAEGIANGVFLGTVPAIGRGGCSALFPGALEFENGLVAFVHDSRLELGSDSGVMKEVGPTMGLEPTTPALQERCATNCAKSA